VRARILLVVDVLIIIGIPIFAMATGALRWVFAAF
jgi:hypothetical protein